MDTRQGHECSSSTHTCMQCIAKTLCTYVRVTIIFVRSWPPIQHHNSSERPTLAAGQAPHHLQSRNSDASSSSSSLSSVLGWPRRVQLNRLSSADQSSRDTGTENSNPVRKTGLLCLRSRRVEQSSSICPHRRFRTSAVFSKFICSSLRLIINCFYFLFYHFWLCNARSAGFYLVRLGTITFYHIIIIAYYHISMSNTDMPILRDQAYSTLNLKYSIQHD